MDKVWLRRIIVRSDKSIDKVRLCRIIGMSDKSMDKVRMKIDPDCCEEEDSGQGKAAQERSGSLLRDTSP
jgi:hypothetical protein